MRFLITILFAASTLSVFPQTRKEVIASQHATLDSLTGLAFQRLERITWLDSQLSAKEGENDDLKRLRGQMLERIDSLYTVAAASTERANAQQLRFRGRPADSSDPAVGISLRRTVLCFFSSRNDRDRFELEVQGRDLATSIYTFFIRTATGNELFRSDIEFIHPDELTLPDELLAARIEQRLNAFFSEERFRVILPDNRTGTHTRAERTHMVLSRSLIADLDPMSANNAFLMETASGGSPKVLTVGHSGQVMSSTYTE